AARLFVAGGRHAQRIALPGRYAGPGPRISDNGGFPCTEATAMPGTHAEEFVRFALDHGVLRFGEFTVKSGRLSPYFFNAGLFNDGGAVGRLARFYAQALVDSGLGFDMLFGPAYKGIPLAT